MVEIYIEQFILFLLIFLRVSAGLLTAPMFGHQTIPLQVKVVLSMFLSYVLFAFSMAQSVKVDLNLLSLFILAVKEMVAGATLGFSIGIIFGGVRYAGELMSYDMGFSMATMFDPENNASFPVLSEILYWFLLMIFIVLNGHHFIIEALISSYKIIPIGEWNISEAAVQKMVFLTGQMFVVAVKIAAPVLVSLFIANIALGVLNKAMPQMNIFGVMFSLKIGLGAIVMIATIPVIAFVFKKILSTFESSIIEFMSLL
jgi:flagellar biosynthetic protein FliR